MKKVCKAVFCAIVILSLAIFSQQETKAGETNERYYSKKTYSVLSVNVGNSDPRSRDPRLQPDERELLVKLRPGSDEEKKVMSGIQDLKPDILILIEAFNKGQAESICFDWNSRKLAYSVHGGDYDFICVKKDIGDVIKHESMPEDGSYEKYKGNSVGYVDVGLKDEGGRKVRLFYAHFPSPQLKWSLEEHTAHKNAFNWICENLKSDIPCLMGGDLNNDFTRGKSQIDIEAALITNPLLAKKYREEQEKTHSSLYIEKQVKDLHLWIFNPLAQPLQLQFLDGSAKQNYEATYRLPEEVWKTTIDWVMGKFCVPPFLAPGAQEIDLITGTTGTIRTNFITSPPDWWKDTGAEISRLRFDHKPLYGKVVFFWKEPIQPDILGKWVADNLRLADISWFQFEQDGTVLQKGPYGNIKIRETDCGSGQWEIVQDSKITFTFIDPFTGQKGLKAEGRIDGDMIKEFKLGGLDMGIPLIKGPNAEAVKTTPKGTVWSEYVGKHPQVEFTWGWVIRSDKSFLATVSVINKWKITESGLIKVYTKDEKGNDIDLWTMEVKDNKLLDKTCGSVYVRAKKGGD